MRDERLGSYSTDATTAGIPHLVALEIHHPVRLLAPPPMNRRQ